MHRYKNNMSDGYLFGRELEFFRNFVRNWDADVEDCDFFDIFSNSNNVSESSAVEMLGKSFSKEELEAIPAIRVHFDEKNPSKKMRLAVRDVDDIICDIWNSKELRERCREMLVDWTYRMEKAKNRVRKQKDPFESRFNEVCRTLRLNEVEADILAYGVVRVLSCFDDFPSRQRTGRNNKATFIAMAVDRPVSTVTRALAEDGRLRRYNVLDYEGDFSRNGAFHEYLEGYGSGALTGKFYSEIKTDDVLPWKYFGSLAETHGEMLKKLISATRGRRGLNILLYGAPGTGKTSFTKTLARELGLTVYEIKQGDVGEEKISAESRLAGIQICNEQAPRETGLVMVDEADQLLKTRGDAYSVFFRGANPCGTEKGVINTVLDEVTMPTIWISNAPAESMDDSVRRRFDYSICFRELSCEQRKAIWRNSVEKLRLGRLVTPQMVETLAGKYPTSAGGIAMVLKNVRDLKPRKGEVEGIVDRLMKPHCELMGSTRSDERILPAKDYSLDGLNIRGDLALNEIVEAVRRFQDELRTDRGSGVDRPRMNVLLWGPPGTGKTEFVKYLGKALDTKVMVRMGSDILSKWVGGTEANIAAAFEQAESERAILFLDEIDGLVQGREGASHSWEVTQVNELLHQMENFRGVMVGATNFMDNLDPAVLRRFTFKMQFDYLDDDGKRLFFERMFHTELNADESRRLAEIPNLSAGDFRTVRQSLYYVGGGADNARRLTGLEKESSLKRETRHRKIGF